jgi:hypothetical protein
MLRSVARVGGLLRLTVLGGVGEVEGFDVFWEAARSVVGSLVGPESYPHHSVGEVGALAAVTAAAGWQVTGTQRIVGVRRCAMDELWQWLWGSLPLRFEDGSFLEGVQRAALELRIRSVFEPLAERWAIADTEYYDVPSVAWMVSATAPAVVSAGVASRCGESRVP